MTARTTEEEEACSNLYLPAEIWESIFKFFDGDNTIFNSLSVVSKQFLSLTNRLRLSFTITDKTIPFLCRLFHRFSNLTSLRLVLSSNRRDDNDFNVLLRLISTFPNLSNIKSLFLYNGCSNIPANGLQALSKKITNLTSFTCCGMNYIYKKHLFFIADCFPLLEELDLRVSNTLHLLLEEDDHHHDQLLGLPKLRKINLSGTIFDHQYIVDICKNCELLQDIIVIDLVTLRKTQKQSFVPTRKRKWIPSTQRKRKSCIPLGRRRRWG